VSAPAWFWAALRSSRRIYTGSPCHSCQRAHAESMLCDDGRTHAGKHSRSAFAWYASYPAGYTARISCGSRPARTATCPPLPVSLVCHYLQNTSIRGMHDDQLATCAHTVWIAWNLKQQSRNLHHRFRSLRCIWLGAECERDCADYQRATHTG